MLLLGGVGPPPNSLYANPKREYSNITQLRASHTATIDTLILTTATSPQIDFSQVGKAKHESMPIDDYIAWVSSPDFAGDPCSKTHYMLGSGYYVMPEPSKATGWHQINATFQRHTAPDKNTIEATSTIHGTVEQYYEHVNGRWRFAGHKTYVALLSGGIEKTIGGDDLKGERKDWEKLQVEKPHHELDL